MKMGYKCGSGLGKYEQGIVEPIQVRYHVGKRGLGSEIKKVHETEWNDGRDVHIKIQTQTVFFLNNVKLSEFFFA